MTAKLCKAARPAAFTEMPSAGAELSCPTQHRPIPAVRENQAQDDFPREQVLRNTPRCFKGNDYFWCVNQEPTPGSPTPPSVAIAGQARPAGGGVPPPGPS